MNELREKIDDLLRDSKAEIAGYDNSKVIPAILDAVIAALPEERQNQYVLEGGDIHSQEGNQRFHRYGGYDAALNNVRRILIAAKENKS